MTPMGTHPLALPRAMIYGVPTKPTAASRFPFTIGAFGIVSYFWQLDGGVWSGERTVSTLLELPSLRPGTHVVRVMGKNDRGVWQGFGEATEARWEVDVSFLQLLNNLLLRGEE